MEPRLTEKKRKAIVDAASELFLDKGYGSVSMDNIASYAKVSKRTVYNHFSSKEDLFSEVVTCIWSEHSVPQLKYHDGADIRQDLIDFAEQSMDLLYSDKFNKLIRFVMGESGRFPVITRIYSEKGIRSLLITLADYLADAGKGKIDDPFLASQYYLGMVKESLFWPVLLGLIPMPSPEKQKEIINKTAGIFTNIYDLK